MPEDHERETRGAARDLGTGDLFAWGAKQRHLDRSDTAPCPESGICRGMYGIERSIDPPRMKSTSLGSYLYGGEASRLEPARRDSRVTRNRIIFLAMLIGIAVFVMVRMASK